MKAKICFIIVSALVLTLALSSCSTQEEKSKKNESKSSSLKPIYSCPMHPEITSDVAGNCPKCGMELVKKMNKIK